MKVIAKESFKLLGTSICIEEGKIYEATIASNQPDFLEKGLIFVEGILLKRGEWEIVKTIV